VLLILRAFCHAEDGQKLYVRLFLRKRRWIPKSKIIYNDISCDLTSILDHVTSSGLLIDGMYYDLYMCMHVRFALLMFIWRELWCIRLIFKYRMLNIEVVKKFQKSVFKCGQYINFISPLWQQHKRKTYTGKKRKKINYKS